MGNGQTIKALRKILSITQKELACENLSRSSISKIEKGTRNLTKEAAEILAPKLRQIQIKKQIKLDYEITPNLLLGINFDEYNKVLDSLSDNLNDYNEAMNYLIQIDNILYSCNNDVAHSILTSILDILQTKLGKYHRSIKKYADKLIKISKKPNEIVRIHIIMIFAYFKTNNYEAIYLIGDKLESELKYCDKRVAQGFYYNIALAHYESDNLEECLDFIAKGMGVNIKDFELDLKTLEGNVLIQEHKLDRAEKIYNKILESTLDKNFRVTAHSNLCDIAIKKKDFGKATYNLKEAFKYINDISDFPKFNIFLSELILNIELNKDILNLVDKTLDSALKLDEEKKIKRVVHLGVEYYIKTNDIKRVLDFVKILKKFNIDPPYKIMEHLINITQSIEDIKNI